MTFNSLEFVIFLPVVLILYALLDRRGQNVMLLIASYFFYGWWDWRFLFLLLFGTSVDWYAGWKIQELRQAGAPARKPRVCLLVSLILNLTILGFFKYFDFFSSSLRDALGALGVPVSPLVLHLVLPIGISFYTFQTMTYVIDIYRGQLRATPNFLEFALFISFFPHLVAGPILPASALLPQIQRERHPTLDGFMSGAQLALWGFFKKVVIADGLAPIVNAVFAKSAPTGFEALVAIYAFAFQIYCDFSGYTDIARGVARMMGFELILNFNLPYFSTSPKEFWTRWHISLSSWLRDYLYIPLGGNRKGGSRTYLNLMTTMFLGGLWHGAAWNFIWGVYQGALLVAHRAMEPWLDRVFRARTPGGGAVSFGVRVVVMFHLICYGWLLFRAGSFAQIVQMTAALAHPLEGYDPALVLSVAVFVLPLLLVEIVQYVSGKFEPAQLLGWAPVEVRAACLSVIVYLIVFRGAKPQSFIYFQF